MALPKDDETRKRIKPFSGFLGYFPAAVAACAELSFIANEKHNPGEPMHWAKAKSTEQRESQLRHLLDEAADGPLARDPENGVLHAVANLWRAAAQVQTLADQGHNVFAEPIETAGTPLDDRLNAEATKTATEIRNAAETDGFLRAFRDWPPADPFELDRDGRLHDFDTELRLAHKANELYPEQPTQSFITTLTDAFDQFVNVTGSYPSKLIVGEDMHYKLLEELESYLGNQWYRISYDPATVREFAGCKIQIRDDCPPGTAYFY